MELSRRDALTRTERRPELEGVDAKSLPVQLAGPRHHATMTGGVDRSRLVLTAPVVNLPKIRAPEMANSRPVTAVAVRQTGGGWKVSETDELKLEAAALPSRVQLLGDVDALAPDMEKEFRARIGACELVESDPDVVVAIGPPSDWASLPTTEGEREHIVWFECLQDQQVYDVAREILSDAHFLHGAAGLDALAHFLNERGALPAALRQDTSAADALHRLRARWLRTIGGELHRFLEQLDREPSRRISAWRMYLQKLIGGAGSYGMDLVASSARNCLNLMPAHPPLLVWEGESLAALQEAIGKEQARQDNIVSGAGTAIELSVRSRVLVLADDALLARQLDFALTARHLEVVVEKSVPSVLKRVARVQPDAIVVQAKLRDFDGLDVASQLRSVRACEAIPILAVVDGIDAATCQRAARCRLDTWIVRPFSAETAVLTVLAALRRTETIRDLGGRDPVTGLYSHRTTM
ncbi:MAG: hypothetical protein KC502_12110, partial [Myxococcales bacterium]|nr:hypothetical protein [Myxococcales bacterium]